MASRTAFPEPAVSSGGDPLQWLLSIAAAQGGGATRPRDTGTPQKELGQTRRVAVARSSGAVSWGALVRSVLRWPELRSWSQAVLSSLVTVSSGQFWDPGWEVSAGEADPVPWALCPAAWALVSEELLAQGGYTQQRFGEMRSTLHPSMLAASVLAVASARGLCVRAWVTVSPSIWLGTQDCSRCGVPRASETASSPSPSLLIPRVPYAPQGLKGAFWKDPGRHAACQAVRGSMPFAGSHFQTRETPATAVGRSGFLLSGTGWAARPNKNVVLVGAEPSRVRFLPGDRSPLLAGGSQGRQRPLGVGTPPARLGEPWGLQKDEPSGADLVGCGAGKVGGWPLVASGGRVRRRGCGQGPHWAQRRPLAAHRSPATWTLSTETPDQEADGVLTSSPCPHLYSLDKGSWQMLIEGTV